MKLILGLGLLLPGTIQAESITPWREGWNALATAASRQARTIFRQYPASPMAQLGEALAVSQIPPTTRDSQAAVQRMLEAVAASADQTAAHAARYYLGRLAQLDPFTPDPAAAARQYAALIATGVDDEWTRLARVKLALLYLVVLPDVGDLTARLKRVDELLVNTKAPTARRDIHLLIAEIRLYHDLRDATTLAHLDAAAETGGLDDMMQADLLIQRARLSTQLHRDKDARALYTEYLETYPQDNRHFTVAAMLEQLKQEPQ